MIDPNAIQELKVYPPIGVARVGNASRPDEYVIGPETIGGPPTVPGGTPERPARHVGDFRTAKGEIKRQAARFRVYAHMKDGMVQEVTSASATIEWRVVVANLKAGWYEFNQAMDLGALSTVAKRRNLELNLKSGERQRLDIVPSPRTVSGPNAGPVTFDDGSFWGKSVDLGVLRTDAQGRLIFLGGAGKAESFRKGVAPLTFANNTGWHDDLCDGPVRASVTFAGHAPIEAEPGYVTVTPPNYAPGLFGVVNMDDVVREVFYDLGWIFRPTSTSFADDVLPIFRRLSGLQWVNHGLFVLHGFGSPLDASDPDVVARLNDASAANAGWRQSVFNLFRDPNAPNMDNSLIEDRIPQIFGDGVDTIFPPTPTNVANGLLSVTKTQYAHLNRWASGDFTPGVPAGAESAPPAFSALTPAEQIRHLERASLHDCLGGPFHPAMEMTWVMRIPLLWKSAYRPKILPGDDAARQDFGDTLTPWVCTGAGGPYDGAAAGCLTRFLGVPWQTDHTSCNSAADYFPTTFLSMPTFWGPRAPDQVLAEGNYLRAAAVSGAGTVGERQMLKHLMHRVDWLRDIRGIDYFDRLSKMIAEWAELGMVLPIEGQPASLPVPDVRVEQGRVVGNKPNDVRTDKKYQLTEEVEALFAPSAAARTSPAVGMTAGPPPKRIYRPGAI
jgi:L-Lysine epsilon oxidase N-terminal/L-lysine epsilon oxidase C-terminal domain